MVREASKKNIAIAATITLSIFIIGILVGSAISGKRVAYGEKQIKEQKMELDSLQLQYAFIDQAKMENHCAALSSALEENVKELGVTGSKIEAYSADMNFDEEEYKMLKRDYLLSELRFWMFAKKAKELCSKDVTSIIYFYSNEESCFDCSTQAKILTYLKEELKDRLLVFSIDSSFTGEPLIDMVKQAYDVKEFPSLLVNDKIYKGLVTEEELRSVLCETYENKEGVC